MKNNFYSKRSSLEKCWIENEFLSIKASRVIWFSANFNQESTFLKDRNLRGAQWCIGFIHLNKFIQYQGTRACNSMEFFIVWSKMKMDSSNTRERIIVPLDRRTGHLKFTYPGQYWRRGRLLWPLGWGRRGCQGRRHFALLHRRVYPGGWGRILLLPPIVNFFNF